MGESFTIGAAGLTVRDASGAVLAELAFAFAIGAREFRVSRLEKTATGWLGKTNDAGVDVAITAGTDCLCVELRAAAAGEDVAYFVGSQAAAAHVRAFIPDANMGAFPAGASKTFTVSNAAFMKYRLKLAEDLWMIAPQPHVFVLGNRAGRGMGLSIPECLPADAAQLILHERRFHLRFDYCVSSADGGRLPRVYVEMNTASAADALRRHLGHARRLGLMAENRPQPQWWHNPLYCTWGDQCWLLEHGGVPANRSLTRERILGWADRIRGFYDGEVNFIIDDGYFMGFGDYRINTELYASVAEFRALIDELKRRRFRVILWYTPFWLHAGAPQIKEHPDWVLHDRAGALVDAPAGWKGRYHYDWSHPEVREQHRQILHMLLKELDADGMKVDMTYANPPSRDLVRHDEAWAVGNQVCWKVMQFIHAEATRIKSDAFMTFNGVECYFQPFVGAVRLNDLFNMTDATAWYRRAELVTRLMPGTAIDVDGWPCGVEKLREYPFVASVFGAPVTYYLEATEVGYVKFGPAEMNRMAAVWHTYDHARVEAGQRIEIDVDNDLFERRDADGTLRAKSVGRRAFITYGRTIRVSVNADMAVAVPLEAGRTVGKAVCVRADGTRESVPVHVEKGRALIYAEDAGKGILYYELS